jgi:CRP-like cAMP-binding protein/Fe-S-cluster-containing hydrogenase component 2/thioredoxin reductase
MGDRFRVAIIGAGPAGLSAAARAAVRDRESGAGSPSYVLLESNETPAKTIRLYQKGKRVDAQPDYLDLRSDLRFTDGTREEVLQRWSEDISRLGIKSYPNAAVTGFTGQKGDFTVSLSDGATFRAETVVLAAGKQEPNECPGVDRSLCQFQLDDAAAHRNERIFVLGAGDAAIENAVSLAQQNDVFIVDRNAEFVRLNFRNKDAVLKELTKSGSRLKCFRETTVKSLERATQGGEGLVITLQTPRGERREKCDWVLVRYGAGPPRKLLESLKKVGVTAGKDGSLPLKRHCETTCDGVYAVGTLAGCGVIKECLNQGYDVVEWIHGNDIEPVDEPLLQYQFQGLPGGLKPAEYLERFRKLVPMLRELSAVALRRFFVASQVCIAYSETAYADAVQRMESLRATLPVEKRKRATFTQILRDGERLYSRGDRSLSFFTIVTGEVAIQDAVEGPRTIQLERGDFFGESSLLSGQPREESAVAGPGCILIKTERPVMLKFMRAYPPLQEGIRWIFAVRALQRRFAPTVPASELRELAGRLIEKDPKTNQPRTEYPAGAILFKEGETGDSMFLVQSGNVCLSRVQDGQQVVVGQVPAGQLVGEMAVLGNPEYRETATATVASRVLAVSKYDFSRLLAGDTDGSMLGKIQEQAARRARDVARMAASPHASQLMSFLLDQGMGESMNTLVIDETLCIGCDNCEKACADTHGGISRLSRKAGPTFGSVHIADSCRHCEQPHCMDDCPTNCIWRTPDGAVYIDNAACISCGACERSCPYGAISMHAEVPPRSGFLWWLMTGRGTAPGQEPQLTAAQGSSDKKLPRKCDQCIGLSGGPACVRACPTGAALRIGPERYIDLVETSKT